MFTGLVEATGIVHATLRGAKSIRLRIDAKLPGAALRPGDSLAVNGCCLTVVSVNGVRRTKRLAFDLLEETWKRTNFSDLQPGRLVNLERALAIGDRLGGHVVSGHIDGTGTITRWERQATDYLLEVTVPIELRRYLIPKGSIAVDGISLTVAKVTRLGFQVWIIPHTYTVTALRERQVGDRVNLEADILGKYVERLLQYRRL